MEAQKASAFAIYLIVFVCGAAVMVVELVGSRVLAPYAGNSLFVWTSLIGVVLGALALGYYVGGRLADHSPKLETLCVVIFASGLWVALIPVLEGFAGPAMTGLGVKAGSLVASLLLFGPPSLLLGFVSPYAVKLATESMKVVGTSAGSLYAVSTAGSIAGTLLAGFLLIPSFGVKSVLFSVSAALVAVSLYGLRNRIAFASVAFILIGTLAYAFAFAPNMYLFDKDSEYYRIRVVEGNASRSMYLDAQNAGGIRLNSPEHLYDYSKAARLAYALAKSPSRVLVLGLGPGVEVKDYLETFPEGKADVVEIDPMVVEACEKFFNCSFDSRTKLFVEDARVFLSRTDNKYDVIFMDAFNSKYSVPFHLTTVETVRLVKSRLKPGGVYVVNVISSIEGEKSLMFRSEYKTIKSVFRTVYVVPINPNDRTGVQNIILLATDENELSWNEWRERTASINGERVAMWAENRLNESIVTSDVPLLTDDFSPVDNLMAPMFE